MDIKTPHQQLVDQITGHAQSSYEARQVASRMRQLLPERLKQLKNQMSGSGRRAAAERRALVAELYQEWLRELNDLNHTAREERIQYETKMLLLDARRTLRKLAHR